MGTVAYGSLWAMGYALLSDFVVSEYFHALVLLRDFAFDFGGTLQKPFVQSLQNQVLRVLGHGLLAKAGLLHHLVVQVHRHHLHEVVVAKVVCSQYFVKFCHIVNVEKQEGDPCSRQG
jgi:hypothetical protein